MNLVNRANIIRDIRPTEQPPLTSITEINLQRARPFALPIIGSTTQPRFASASFIPQ